MWRQSTMVSINDWWLQELSKKAQFDNVQEINIIMKPQNETEYAEQIADEFRTIWTELHLGDDEEAESIVAEVFQKAGIRITRKDSA